MTEPLHTSDESTPASGSEGTVTPLSETLADVAATVESASADTATALDDMQAATGEASRAAVASVEEVASAPAAAAEETAQAAVATAAATTDAAVAAAEDTLASTITAGSGAAAAAANVGESLALSTDDLRATVDELVTPSAAAPARGGAAAAPVTEAATATAAGDVTSDDRLLAALTWLGLLLLQLPIVSVVILLVEGNKDRPFQRHHAIQSIGFWVGAIIYEIVAAIVFTVKPIVTLGLGALCLWVIFFVPHVLSIVYAWQASQGKEIDIPLISKFMRQQGWLA
ncbi:MAG: DUF4870 domain-containing protein [Anaerolineae bacterium]|nr:MAG: DUF4870 domain-containing protein [Anaerolineae bacterium]